MKRPLYFDDVAVGMELPSFAKQVSTCQFVQWAGVDYDWNPFHYDHIYATKIAGLSGVVGHGALVTAFFGQLLTNWIGPGGFVRRVRGEYRGFVSPGDTLTIKGRVTKKVVEQKLVECELWAENQNQKRVVLGIGIVSIPSGCC